MENPIVAGPLLLISPHRDDAALCCGALLARSEPLDILTVFAGDPQPPSQNEWDRLTGFASSAESGPARRTEEQAAFARSPHRLEMMNLVEGSYLGSRRQQMDGELIAEAIARWLDRTSGGTVALPAGAGRPPGRARAGVARLFCKAGGPVRHPDHLFVRDAALPSLVGRNDVKVLLYEELPYLWGLPADRAVARVARSAGYEALLVVAEVDRDSKAQRLASYPSQLPQLLSPAGRRLDDPAALPRIERYWRFVKRMPARTAARG